MIVWPEAEVSETILEIRNAIGRNIQINITTSGIPCPICQLDPVTNTSVDAFCSGCHGDYWLETTSGLVALGHVRWLSTDMPILHQGGELPQGDCQVTIAFTPENLYAVQHATDFIVDTKRTTLKSYRLKGVPHPNRIAILMLEEGSQNG